MSISDKGIDSENYFDIEMSGGKYQLEKNVKYKISLNAVGNAKYAYAIVNYNGRAHYTDQFEVFSDSSTAEEFTFILSFSENTPIETYPCWGTVLKILLSILKNLREIQKMLPKSSKRNILMLINNTKVK